MVHACRLVSCIVVTGGGMFTLLSAIRHARVEGFALWDAVRHVSLGRTPPGAAALAMAGRIVDAYSPDWPVAVRRAVTTDRIVAQLATGGPLRGYTSPRPALVAYVAGLVQAPPAGSAADPLDAATANVMLKLDTESNRDTATALTLLHPRELRQLRAVAVASTSQQLRAAVGAGCHRSPYHPPALPERGQRHPAAALRRADTRVDDTRRPAGRPRPAQ